MTISTANGAARHHMDRRVRSRRQASTATDTVPTSASGAARRAPAPPAPSARAVDTRSRSVCLREGEDAGGCRRAVCAQGLEKFSEPPLLLACVFVIISTVDKRCASRLVAQAKAGYANRFGTRAGKSRKESKMARFKQVPQHYVLDKVMEYWLNMVRNYREDVHDNDFFDILRRSYS